MYSSIFSTAILIRENLIPFGFVKKGEKFTLRRELSDGEFYVVIEIDPVDNSIKAEVFEKDTDEKYALFSVKRSRGSFVTGMRSEVQGIID